MRSIPGRGGDPWATAEREESYVDREIFGSTLRIDANLGNVGLVAISDYQHSNKFYIEGGDSPPDEGVFFFQGSKLDQVSQEVRLSASMGAHDLVGGVFGMYADGKYTGKFADPFYGYDPDVAFSQRTTSFALFLQDEWNLADRWKLIGGLRFWQDTREGTYLGTETSLTGVTTIFNQNEIFPVFPGSPVTPDTAKRNFSAFTARPLPVSSRLFSRASRSIPKCSTLAAITTTTMTIKPSLRSVRCSPSSISTPK